jgi:endonuclease YncB( thermonuclease family)
MAVAVLLLCLVVGISDGDTLTARCEAQQDRPAATVKVRLAGIDAPERSQAYGQRARKRLSEVAFGKSVALIGNKKDRYGRLVAKVMVAAECAKPPCPQTVDAGRQLVIEGLAWWYRAYIREQAPDDRASYGAAEERARDSRLGLWADASPVPPWEWRKGARLGGPVAEIEGGNLKIFAAGEIKLR